MQKDERTNTQSPQKEIRVFKPAILSEDPPQSAPLAKTPDQVEDWEEEEAWKNASTDEDLSNPHLATSAAITQRGPLTKIPDQVEDWEEGEAWKNASTDDDFHNRHLATSAASSAMMGAAPTPLGASGGSISTDMSRTPLCPCRGGYTGKYTGKHPAPAFVSEAEMAWGLAAFADPRRANERWPDTDDDDDDDDEPPPLFFDLTLPFELAVKPLPQLPATSHPSLESARQDKDLSARL